MPFKKIKRGKQKGKYRSPSGRVFNKRQVARYHARGGTFDLQQFAQSGNSSRLVYDSANKLTHAAQIGDSSNQFHCDAVQRRDPTGTTDIRRRYRAEFERRWRKVLRLARELIVAQDILGLRSVNAAGLALQASFATPSEHGPGSLAALGAESKIKAFQAWFDQTLQREILGGNGDWLGAVVRSPWQRALKRAFRLSGKAIPPPDSQAKQDALQALLVSETQGIMEATSQRAVRAVAEGLLAGEDAPHVLRRIGEAITAVGIARSRPVVEVIVSKAFTQATIDQFRAAGVRQVGLIPETIPVRRIGDAGEGPGSRGGTSRRTVRRIKRVTKKLRTLGEFVNIQTAGDDLVCPICEDLESGGPYALDEALSLIPAHPNCLPGDSLVLASDGILATSERRYEGPMVSIRTASGLVLRCTPNHPILTNRGLVPASLLDVGSNVVCHRDGHWSAPARSVVHDDHENVPTSIEHVARALAEQSKFGRHEVPTARPHFHGDGVDGDVAVVWTDSPLLHKLQTALRQHPAQVGLVLRDVVSPSLLRDGAVPLFLDGRGTPLASGVRGIDLRFALAYGHAAPLDSLLLGGRPPRHAAPFQYPADGAALDSPLAREGVLGLTPAIIPYDHFLDSVAAVSTQNFAGHVFNLHTVSGLYVAQGIVTGNCRCAFVPAENPNPVVEEE